MQPRRKHEDRVDAAFPAEAIPVEQHLVPVPGDAASPALALQAQLAARLAGSATAGPLERSEAKLPMPLRIVTILALSLGLWAGIALAAIAVITK